MFEIDLASGSFHTLFSRYLVRVWRVLYLSKYGNLLTSGHTDKNYVLPYAGTINGVSIYAVKPPGYRPIYCTLRLCWPQRNRFLQITGRISATRSIPFLRNNKKKKPPEIFCPL
jgi:hypothetical protein